MSSAIFFSFAKWRKYRRGSVALSCCGPRYCWASATRPTRKRVVAESLRNSISSNIRFVTVIYEFFHGGERWWLLLRTASMALTGRNTVVINV